MYFLYHIPKRKEWGCTKHLKKRIRNLGYELSDVDRIITCGNIDMAADMERELNIQYNYGWNERHDYRVVTKINKPFTKSAQSKGGITQSSKIKKCPHCNITSSGVAYHRWHGDNCKFNL